MLHPQAHPHDYCLLVTIWTFPWIWPFQQLLLYLPQHLSCKSLSVCGALCLCVLWDRVNTQTPVQMAQSGWSPPDTGIGVTVDGDTLSSELWSPALSEKVQSFYCSKLLIRQGLVFPICLVLVCKWYVFPDKSDKACLSEWFGCSVLILCASGLFSLQFVCSYWWLMQHTEAV